MLALSGKSSSLTKETDTKPSRLPPKKTQESRKGGKDWLDEMVTKQEILDRVGIVDVKILPYVESTLTNLSYKGKTKADVTQEVVSDLEKQIDRLKYQRVKMMQVKRIYYIKLNIIKGSTGGEC